MIRDLNLVRLDSSSSELSAIWNYLIGFEHPLGVTRFFGRQIRYLIQSANGWLGAIGFSSAALQIKGRDKWIGWSYEEKKKNLNLVVNMSRFLIRPDIECKNLASRVLSLCSQEIVKDWHKKYGQTPVLLETFVNSKLYNGTCYQASNWKRICETTGRGRQDRGKIFGLDKKGYFVFPLKSGFQNILCNGRNMNYSPRDIYSQAESNPNWIEEEFRDLSLGDNRLTQRALKILSAKWRRPTATLPQLFKNSHQLKAAYRLFSNKKKEVNMEEFLKPHLIKTAERMASEKIVLAVSDTTYFDYNHLSECASDLSYIGKNKHSSLYGIPLHTTLAFNEKGVPLGILDAQTHFRGKEKRPLKDRKSVPIEEKESFRWIRGYRATEEIAQRIESSCIVYVCDREGDIYDLFEEQKKQGQKTELLIRSSSNRRLEEIDSLVWDHVESTKPAGTMRIQVPRKKGQKARTAKCEVRYIETNLRPPNNYDGKVRTPRKITYVSLKEKKPPEGTEPLDWMLLTTVKVESMKMAGKVIQWYCKRWGIEDWHKIIKSGCKAQDRQLETAEALKMAMAFDLIIAWRVLMLVRLGREAPDMPCTVYFDQTEWKSLYIFNNYGDDVEYPDKPPDEPTLNEMLREVAMLGGFQNRKSDGEPGYKTVWVGLIRLHDITATVSRCYRGREPAWHKEFYTPPP